jgi:hypothetical protein
MRAKKSTSPVTPAAPVIETVNVYVQVSPVEVVNVGPEVMVAAPAAEKPERFWIPGMTVLPVVFVWGKSTVITCV